MPSIEPINARYAKRMDAASAFSSLRSALAPAAAQALPTHAAKVPVFDAVEIQVALSGPGWYESSWDLTQGLVVRESTAAGAGKLDEWSPCFFG